MDIEIINLLKEKRPSLSDSSIMTYKSILKNMYKLLNPEGDVFNPKVFDNTKEIINLLKDLPSNARKTRLSALVVVSDKKEYRELMLDDIKNYNKEISKQEKTDNQKDNWVYEDEINKLINTLKKNANTIYKKISLTSDDLQDIQNYIIICLFGGVYIPPRRSKDYVNFEIKNIDKEKNNYLDKDEFIFNSYKTAKTYGQQKVKIPSELKSIINKWIKINPSNTLLFDVNLNPLTNVKLNQRLNKILGKKASVNVLRHEYLTRKYGDMIDKKKELDKDFKDMGSSSLQYETYVKK